jgi:hypothetical protein
LAVVVLDHQVVLLERRGVTLYSALLHLLVAVAEVVEAALVQLVDLVVEEVITVMVLLVLPIKVTQEEMANTQKALVEEVEHLLLEITQA